ncbi:MULTISPECIES: hypothetical protein [unclassified Bradyrhizobium]|uniref:hypothetical protein n=1 Tax=unclassified Bradyrhizobium TaxID=2631580 RepID=UPI0015CB8711|nr:MULTISPECIES: hypothetical protein [unclassified Bradyrhizobium]MBB4259716.1 hypothetical protein [Bradyrhizobium sp. CIR3A]NYG47584.1 hypothetical protein [Bradyrhizobium sp. IAR9]
MTALVSYSTGTASVSAGGTTVTGSGTNWLGTIAKPGDIFQIGNFQSVISDVTDTTHLVIPPWGGGNQSGVAYTIWQVSPQRFAGAQAMATVSQLVAAFNTSGYFVFVGIDETVPDPSLGDDGQFAFQPTTGKTWERVAGVWTFLGIYKGFNLTGDYDNATVYSYGDVQTTSGSSYIYINETPSAGHTAPNTTYWQLLASKGDTGAAGSNGATGATGPAGAGATGQCKLVKSGSNLVLQQFNGNAIRINGQVCTVPNAGVSLAPTGLTPGTSYFIYATQSGGVVNALEASTTAHATSTTSGNEGTEIKSGDDARSLVGMARVVTGPAWADSATQRFVISWFNRDRRSLAGALDGTSTETSTGSYVEKAVSKVEYLCWAGELLQLITYGIVTNSVNNGAVGVMNMLDGVTVGGQADVNPGGTSFRCPVSATYNVSASSEGYHYSDFGLRALGGGTASASYGVTHTTVVG